MEMLVRPNQAKKNRESVREMWKGIPREWVELNTIMRASDMDHALYDRDDYVIAEACGGRGGPHNECGAVGCFGGWIMAYHPYRQWCMRHGLKVYSFDNISVWLGVERQSHGLFKGREVPYISQKAEVNRRIKVMMKMPIHDEPQPVFSD